MWQTKLISLYCAVCDNSSIIKREMQRQSNNFRPQFTDEECITVYLWGISQRRFEQCGDTLFTGDTMSTFVSSVRQPIESFFNWLSDLTNIQAASKVRSSQGLLLHIFGRVAFAMFTILFGKFNP